VITALLSFTHAPDEPLLNIRFDGLFHRSALHEPWFFGVICVRESARATSKPVRRTGRKKSMHYKVYRKSSSERAPPFGVPPWGPPVNI